MRNFRPLSYGRATICYNADIAAAKFPKKKTTTISIPQALGFKLLKTGREQQ